MILSCGEDVKGEGAMVGGGDRAMGYYALK
jgi:hypothetical protein